MRHTSSPYHPLRDTSTSRTVLWLPLAPLRQLVHHLWVVTSMKTLSLMIIKHEIIEKNHSEAFQHTNMYPFQAKPTGSKPLKWRVGLLSLTAESGPQAFASSWKETVFPTARLQTGNKSTAFSTLVVSAQFELRWSAWPKIKHVEFLKMISCSQKTARIFLDFMKMY